MANLSILSQLESYLSATSQRQAVVAANVANIDTPGYHTKDVDFQRELSKAMEPSASAATRQASTHEVKGLLERADGNNVDIDRESLLLAESQLQYQMGTQLLKSRFHELLTAINSGS